MLLPTILVTVVILMLSALDLKYHFLSKFLVATIATITTMITATILAILLILEGLNFSVADGYQVHL